MAIRLRVQENRVRLSVGGDTIHLSATEKMPVYPDYYTGAYEVTPIEAEQSLVSHGLMMTDDVTVHAIASDYVGSGISRRSSTDITASGATVSVPSGFYESPASKSVASGSASTPATSITATPSISVSQSGLITASVSASKDVTPSVFPGYVENGSAGTVNVSGSNTSQLATKAATTITPTRSEQTAVGANIYTTGAVKVGAIPQEYIIPSGSQTATSNDTYDVTSLAEMVVDVPAPNLQSKSVSYTPTETAQTDSVSADSGYDGLSGVGVSVGAIPPNYVGSDITRRSSSDLTSSGATVTVPSGYYENNASKAVASGTSGTPTASKGTVSNHSVSVTPSVTNTAGYISGGTKNGTAVSVSASELVSGTKSISANGTGIDVTNYASVDVAVPSVAPTLQTKSVSITPSTSAQTQTVTPDTGYEGLDEVDISVSAMPSGTEGRPTATKGSVSSHAITITPSVTNSAGYISGGTHTGTAVSVSASELVSGTVNITSSGNTDVTNYATASVASGGATASATKGTVSNHSISVTPSVTRTAGYITAGTASGTAVTVSASELVSGSETKTENGTYDVTNLAELVVNVSGGGGTSKNTQVVQGTTRTTSSTMTAIGAEMTVSKTGTYDVYWSAFRSSTSSSYTYATQLYIDGTAYGSENATWSNHCQNNHLTKVSLTVNQKIRVRGRNSRGSSYYIYAPTLVIVEN